MADRNVKGYQFFKNLRQFPCIEKIILYGSRARGDHHDRSDIDLAIACPNATDKDWLEILDIIEEADTLLNIDCARLDQLKEDNPLKIAIERDGVVLYEKESE